MSAINVSYDIKAFKEEMSKEKFHILLNCGWEKERNNSHQIEIVTLEKFKNGLVDWLNNLVTCKSDTEIDLVDEHGKTQHLILKAKNELCEIGWASLFKGRKESEYERTLKQRKKEAFILLRHCFGSICKEQALKKLLADDPETVKMLADTAN